MSSQDSESRPVNITRNDGSRVPEKTKDRLYNAVLQLFAVNDFHRAKIRDISKKSGLSVSNIYRYFSSKEELLFAVLAERIGAVYELIELHIQGLRSGKEIFRKIVWVTMDYYDKRPELAITAIITVPTRTWMQHESFAAVRLKEVFTKVVDKLRDSGAIDPRVDLHAFQDFFYMICYRYITIWYYFGRSWKLADAVDQDFDLLWKLLANPTSDREWSELSRQSVGLTSSQLLKPTPRRRKNRGRH